LGAAFLSVLEMFMAQLSSAFVAGPELLEELLKRSKPIALGSNRVLFREGEKPTGVYIVRSGSALLTSGSNGETVLRVEAGVGSLLGVPAVIGGKSYSLTAEALEGAEISLMSLEDFVNLMQAEPHFAFQVLKVLAEEVRFARESFSYQ
jgi:CRP/FNR family transcriptional regulator